MVAGLLAFLGPAAHTALDPVADGGAGGPRGRRDRTLEPALGRSSGGPRASAVYLFLPALAVLGAGFFIDDALDGYARPAAALVPAAAIGAIAYGEYQTVDFGSRLYGPMRLLLAVATYLSRSRSTRSFSRRACSCRRGVCALA